MEYRFGSFVLDDKTGKVCGAGGAEVKLRPQTFRLLEVLIKNYPKILSRDQLIDQVWSSEHLSANSLPQAVSELRQALGDDPQTPRYIETVHRRGYRFIGKVGVEATRPFLVPVKPAVRARRRLAWGLVAALGVVILVALGLQLSARRISTAEAETLPAADTPEGKALRLYYEGLYAQRRDDAPAARELLAEAAVLDPGSRQIAQALAEIDRELGATRNGGGAAAMLEQARLAFVDGELERSAQLGEHALELARTHAEPKLVGRALEQLSRVALYRGEPAQALAMLGEARQLHQQNGDHRALARNRELEAEVLVHQGDVDGALEQRAAALAVWRSLGDRYEEALALQSQGGLLARTGHFAEALATWRLADELFRQVGDRRGEAATAAEVATVLTARGQLRQARELLTRSLAFDRTTNSARDTARTLYSLAVIDLRTGRGEQARAALEEALSALRAAGDRMSSCFVQRKLGDTLAQLGELEAARRELEAALAESRALGHRIVEGMTLASLGWLELHEGDLRGARNRLEAALAVRGSTSDPGNAADDQLGLAELDLAEGHPARAVEKARAAAEFFASQGAASYEAQAVALGARASAQLGRTAEAQTAVTHAASLLAGTEDVQAQLTTQLDLALARAALGEHAEASAALRALGERAAALGYGALARQTERALTEIPTEKAILKVP